VRIIDGDTIECQLHLGWGLTWQKRIVRMAGYDAWEVRAGEGITDEHLEQGRIAAAEFAEMFEVASYPVIIPAGDGGFNRECGWLRWIMSDGKIVKAEEWALKNGHVKQP
jgi:hypothetical protein